MPITRADLFIALGFLAFGAIGFGIDLLIGAGVVGGIIGFIGGGLVGAFLAWIGAERMGW